MVGRARHAVRFGGFKGHPCVGFLRVAVLAIGVCPMLTHAQESQPATAPTATTTSSAPATSATTAPAPTTLPATSRPVALTVESVQLSLKQAEARTDLDAAAKADAIKLYEQAIQQLQIAGDWAAKAANYEAVRKKAPGALEAIKAELAKPTPEPVPDVPDDASLPDLEQGVAQVEAELEAAKKAEADLAEEQSLRTKRRVEIPKLLAEARERLNAKTDGADAPAEGVPTALAAAGETLSRARALYRQRPGTRQARRCRVPARWR